jgi:hypothetical protein
MGTAKEHEIRIVGYGLATLAVLAAVLAIWAAAAVSDKVRSHSPSAPVTQSSGGALVGSLDRS